MQIITRRGWGIAEARVTPEAIVLGRREALTRTAAAGMIAGAGMLLPRTAGATGEAGPVSAPVNTKYALAAR